jgi:hypothetical protein
MASIIEINGKTYNEAVLKRHICRVCDLSNYPNLSRIFWRVNFTEEVEKLHDEPAYEGIEANYFGYYICQGCLSELVSNYPEVVKQVRREFPRP